MIAAGVIAAIIFLKPSPADKAETKTKSESVSQIKKINQINQQKMKRKPRQMKKRMKKRNMIRQKAGFIDMNLLLQM